MPGSMHSPIAKLVETQRIANSTSTRFQIFIFTTAITLLHCSFLPYQSLRSYAVCTVCTCVYL